MKAIGYIASWTLYWLGHWSWQISTLAPDNDRWAWWAETWYTPYNWLMLRSSDIQDATRCAGPWGTKEIF
jgi:hypothetical protein